MYVGVKIAANVIWIAAFAIPATGISSAKIIVLREKISCIQENPAIAVIQCWW